MCNFHSHIQQTRSPMQSRCTSSFQSIKTSLIQNYKQTNKPVYSINYFYYDTAYKQCIIYDMQYARGTRI